MEPKKYTLERIMTDEQGEALKGQQLATTYIKHPIIDHDADGYDTKGRLLFRFRRGAIPMEILKLGVDNFEKSIGKTEGRGLAAGEKFFRPRKDGTVGNTSVAPVVESGNVGFMDGAAQNPYCRMTNFGRQYFNHFRDGIPFVKYVSDLYAQLCPDHYAIQKMYAEGTNQNYVIQGTAFTTVTVNRNFRTSLHKDSGDLPQGFGNLIAYREGEWTGAYFMLPEFGVGIDLQNTDVLFVDVHRWHCNTPFVDFDPARDKRISFVMYYREGMVHCPTPTEELKRLKQDKNGFLRL